MNNMNPLEKQLQSWVPRRPSAGLKERIFGEGEAGAGKGSEAGLSGVFVFSAWVKFAPVMCILLTIMLLGVDHRPKAGYLAVAGGSNMLASLSSNMLVLCATDMRDQRENVWTGVNFDWTKAGHSLTTTGSLPSWKTNVHKL